MGLDPRRPKHSRVLSPPEVKSLLERNSLLAQGSQTSLRLLEASLQNIPHGTILSDAQGYVLYKSGTEPISGIFDKTGIVPGGNCLESTIGTTAPGLAIIHKIPIIVQMEEHYNEVYHWCCCAAAPIFNLDGGVAGCINVTTNHENTDKLEFIYRLTLTMAKCLQSELHLMQCLSGLEVSKEIIGSVVNLTDRAVMVVDMSGTILQANQRAGSVLKTPVSHLISRHYSDFFKSDSLSCCLSTKKADHGLAVCSKETGEVRKLWLQAQAIHDASGHIVGATAILEEHKRHWPGQQGGAYGKSFTFNNIIGKSAGMLKAVNLGKRFASTDANILLYGETGTGKELFSQAIHNLSHRRNKPFIAINAAAIPGGLVESELFGYRNGAFTGASREGKKGLFELANQGTLFLDEINSMPMDLQCKLLRVIENGEITPLGAHSSENVDVRIIAATGHDPDSGLTFAELRKDLFYRLSTIRIFLPPLRERLDDIEELAIAFLKQFAEKSGKNVNLIHPEALKILQYNEWPGNVRELMSAIEFAVHVTDMHTIMPEHLPDYLGQSTPEEGGAGNEASKIVSDLENGLIRKALEETRGNRSEAARKLGVSRSTFYRKCCKYKLASLRRQEPGQTFDSL
ncbi:MAG: sigma 54-interacting transcriptional regulator [Syntrophobacteraceae bacterium]|nr:sigma 54-interacting transcriptional regulator [Syntrophobacteraceae bacterium]